MGQFSIMHSLFLMKYCFPFMALLKHSHMCFVDDSDTLNTNKGSDVYTFPKPFHASGKEEQSLPMFIENTDF